MMEWGSSQGRKAPVEGRQQGRQGRTKLFQIGKHLHEGAPLAGLQQVDGEGETLVRLPGLSIATRYYCSRGTLAMTRETLPPLGP